MLMRCKSLLFVAVLLPACFGGPNTIGHDWTTGTGGGGWVAAGGRGTGGAAGAGGGGAGGTPLAACVVPDPQYPDAAVAPLSIVTDWCNEARSCAACTWEFPGVGIFIAGLPAGLCTLPDPSLGSVTCAPACSACPGGAPATSGVGGSGGHKSDAGVPGDCVTPAVPGGDLYVTWCNEGHSCAACGWTDASGIHMTTPSSLCTFAGLTCPDASGSATIAGSVPSCGVPDSETFDAEQVDFDESGAPSACVGVNVRNHNGLVSQDFAVTPCHLGGFMCAPSCSACP